MGDPDPKGLDSDSGVGRVEEDEGKVEKDLESS